MHVTRKLSSFSAAWVRGQFIRHPPAAALAPLLPCGLHLAAFCGHYDRGDLKGLERVLNRKGLNSHNVKTSAAWA